jgi:TPR repeat protein
MLARAMEGQTMKRIILAAAFIAILGSTGMSWAADFQKGVAAYESGDFATALQEWKPLAEQGHAEAQSSLGALYNIGRGVPKDIKLAVKWFRLAAKQGDADAQYSLGWMYAKGQGVPQDNKTAVKWWKLAAEGDAEAQKLARECVRKKYKGC